MGVGYLLGEHVLVTCDPAVESMLSAAVVGMEPNLDAWKHVAAENSGELLGAGRMQLLVDPNVKSPGLPAGFEHRTLENDDPEAIALIAALIDVSSEDDLDEAELDIDDLDKTMDVVIGPTGEVAAYASARSFEMAHTHGDIGVITREDHRGLGLGVAVVALLSARLFTEGIEPLYRCGEENNGSMRLSASLGFEPATRLVAYRFPSPALAN